MLTNLYLLEQAGYLTTNKSDLPQVSQVVETLKTIEKESKQAKPNYSFNDLIGSWNLRFLTGTKKARKRAGIVLGKGQYLPKIVKIQITYEQDKLPTINTGRVKNSVKLGFLNLSLTGPVKFIPQKNILAFDFTTLTLTVFGLKVYDGYIKDGEIKESKFQTQSITQQAFFSYFLIQKNLIAARGRGGGLALWSREEKQSFKI
jgi:hypothetical protein